MIPGAQSIINECPPPWIVQPIFAIWPELIEDGLMNEVTTGVSAKTCKAKMLAIKQK